MYLRTTRVRHGDTTYIYRQLVESVRKPGGAVTKRVVASLGQLSELEVANWKTNLEASRQAKRVAIVTPRDSSSKLRAPDASLRYLDVAVLVECWREAGLARLLEAVLPAQKTDVSSADVLAALVVHRCVAGRSKLHAEQWLPTTALPELLDIRPASFNNTRLHRVLDQLHRASPEIQRRLPQTYGLERQGVNAFYLDITDTWFEGQGPSLAKPGRAKDDVIRRKIGILLLCTDDGRPLRWEVLSGDAAEAPAMLSMLRSERWTRGPGPPVVIDRALGRTAYLSELVDADVPFLTALTRPEFTTYAPSLPVRALDDLALPSEPTPAALAPVHDAIVEAGMTRISDDLFVLDLGVVDVTPESGGSEQVDGDASDGGGSGRCAVELARRIQAEVDSGSAPSRPVAGARMGLSVSATKTICALLRLSPLVQEALLDRRADSVSTWTLRNLAKLPADEQLDALHQAEAQARGRRRPTARPARPRAAAFPRVRAVAYFNPQLWWNQRRNASERLARVEQLEAQLNDKLGRGHLSLPQAHKRIERYLTRMGHLTAFDVEASSHDGDRGVAVVSLRPNDDWQRRRRLDGFSVLVAHPSLTQTPVELCRRYRAKDVIEKDFQVIKSHVRLRPVWHHNDNKVRAHVTLCILALALERAVRRRLKGELSVRTALETLSSVALQRYASSGGDAEFYTLTKPNPDQAKLLAAAGLGHLADDGSLASRITPRHQL